MDCPRCRITLMEEQKAGLEIDRCPQCNGRWLDHHELDLLEARTIPDADRRQATIEYAERPSELSCPDCGTPMRAFNYRAYDLELDTCPERHGFWIDAGEEGQMHDILEERVRGLERASSAEESWRRFVGNMGQTSVWDQIKNLFGGGRR